MKLCFIDIETTGLDHKSDKIWQIAGCIRINGKIKKRFDFKTTYSEPDEKKLYHLLVNVLNKYVNKFDKNDKMHFIAYNSRFDENFIRELFVRNGDKFYGSYFFTPSIDIMQMAAIYFMLQRKTLENFKLSTVCKAIGINIDENRLHDGAYDIEVSRNLYNRLDRKFKRMK